MNVLGVWHLQAVVLLLLAATAVLLPACATAASNAADPVRVDYYMEALCP